MKIKILNVFLWTMLVIVCLAYFGASIYVGYEFIEEQRISFGEFVFRFAIFSLMLYPFRWALCSLKGYIKELECADYDD